VPRAKSSGLLVAAGFGGMRDYQGELLFRPWLPARWQRLRFQLTFRGRRFEVDVTRENVTYRLHEGERLTFTHHDEEVTLSPDEPTVVHPYA